MRISFGILWAVDAYLKWQPTFISGFIGYIQGAASGQPRWLVPWFRLWQHLMAGGPRLFAYLTALGLILGPARKAGYIVAALFSLGVWSVAEGFGGPYAASATDIGTGIVYAVVFLALYGLDSVVGDSPWSLDAWVCERWPGWRPVGAFGGPAVGAPTVTGAPRDLT